MLTRRQFFHVAPITVGVLACGSVKKAPAWTLKDLQWIADTIAQKYDQQVSGLVCSDTNRRWLVDRHLTSQNGSNLTCGEVRVNVDPQLGDDCWIAHTYTGDSFHFNPERRELQRQWPRISPFFTPCEG